MLTPKQKEELNWTDQPVVGLSLIIMGGSIDSNGDQIKATIYYEVGKHKTTGKVAIIPTSRN